jgi:hypothetical protein
MWRRWRSSSRLSRGPQLTTVSRVVTTVGSVVTTVGGLRQQWQLLAPLGRGCCFLAFHRAGRCCGSYAADGPQASAAVLTDASALLFTRGPSERGQLERISSVLGVTLGEAKALGFKKKALLELDEAELQVWGGTGTLAGMPRMWCRACSAAFDSVCLHACLLACVCIGAVLCGAAG